jgi:hypothetical protein
MALTVKSVLGFALSGGFFANAGSAAVASRTAISTMAVRTETTLLVLAFMGPSSSLFLVRGIIRTPRLWARRPAARTVGSKAGEYLVWSLGLTGRFVYSLFS